MIICFRSLSSDGLHARQTLRHYESLLESILSVMKSAITSGNFDCSAVEHSACLLRNLSFACQEVVDPNYLESTASRFQSDSDGKQH
jgi:hypothetical protein